MSVEIRLAAYILAQLNILPRCYFWRQNTGVAKAGDRSIRFGVPGQADITGVANGRRVEIEVKSPTGRQRPDQKAFQSRITDAGGIYIVARSLDDALIPVRGLL
jgi:hypothetical protein